MKQIIDHLLALLKQKREKHYSQKVSDRNGYDAGWIDGLKYAIDLLEKENNKKVGEKK